MSHDIYMQTVFGQQPAPRVEVVINLLELSSYAPVFYTEVVNRLMNAGVPVRPHTYVSGAGVSEQIKFHVTRGTLTWESWDFGKTIRYIWTET